MCVQTVYVLTVAAVGCECDLLGVFTSAEAARVRAAEYCYEKSCDAYQMRVCEWGIYDTPQGCDMADIAYTPSDAGDESWFTITRATIGHSCEHQIGVSY